MNRKKESRGKKLKREIYEMKRDSKTRWWANTKQTSNTDNEGNRSDQISRSVVSDSLRPHESQHARPPCPSPTPGVHSDSRPSSQWCHPAISWNKKRNVIIDAEKMLYKGCYIIHCTKKVVCFDETNSIKIGNNQY